MGELEPLPIPEHRWDTISVDFIVELPEAHRYDVIMNVVDLASKQAVITQTSLMIINSEDICGSTYNTKSPFEPWQFPPNLAIHLYIRLYLYSCLVSL